MKKLMRLFSAGLMCLAIGLLTGCGSSSAAQTGSPEDLAKYFFNRLSAGDVNAAAEVMDPEQAQLMSAEEIKAPLKRKAATYQAHSGIKEFKLQLTGSGNSMIVQGFLIMNDGSSQRAYEALRKINGKWYVA